MRQQGGEKLIDDLDEIGVAMQSVPAIPVQMFTPNVFDRKERSFPGQHRRRRGPKLLWVPSRQRRAAPMTSLLKSGARPTVRRETQQLARKRA